MKDGATKVRHVDFWPDEWLGGTGNLSLLERGVYITACALIYSRGGPIAVDHLRRQCPGHGRVINAALNRLIELGKIVETEGKLDQNRCETELKHARNRIETSRQNGAKGGRPNGLGKPTGSDARATTTNYQLGKEEGFSPKALNPGFLPAPAGSPPLPSRGDGGEPLRATTKEPEPSSDDLIDPAAKAAALDELLRDLEARNKAKSLNGQQETAQ